MTDTSAIERPVRALVVSRCASAYGNSRGGADVLARHHAAILAREAVQVTFVGTAPVEQQGVTNVLVQPARFPMGGSQRSGTHSVSYLVVEWIHVVQGALAGAKVLRRSPIDLTISNSSLTTILLKLLSRRAPVIHYIHDGIFGGGQDDPEDRGFFRWLLNNLLEKVAIRLAERVICASDGIASAALALGVAEEKLTIMYPFLQGSMGPAPLLQPGGDLTESEIDGLAPFLLSVGQQTGRKRFDLLIRAMKRLPEGLRLVLVGDGPLHDTYRRLADAENVSDRVAFLTDVSDHGLAQLYRGCVTYVLASENEGFPITVAEALFHGCPVVLACPSTTQLRTSLPGDHLIILPDPTEDAVVSGVREILLREEVVTGEIRRTIRNWAKTRFPSEEQVGGEYLRIFRGLLPASNVRRPVASRLSAGP